MDCAVNLTDENESAVAPKVFKSPIKPVDSKDPSVSPMITEFWRPVAFMAILLLLLEWSTFHRRRQG